MKTTDNWQDIYFNNQQYPQESQYDYYGHPWEQEEDETYTCETCGDTVPLFSDCRCVLFDEEDYL